MGERKTEPGDLLRATLDMLIAENPARGAIVGYGIAGDFHLRTGEVRRVAEGARQRLQAPDCGKSDNDRSARFYRSKAAAREPLAEQTGHRDGMAAIAPILEPA